MLTKKMQFTDDDRIFAVIAMCAVTAVVLITSGYITEKRMASESDIPVIAVDAVVEETHKRSDEGLWENGDNESAVSDETAAEDNIGYSSPAPPVTVSAVSKAESKSTLVNINTADRETLMTLDGVGEKTADKIIAYREDTPFESIEDIMNVNGIAEKKFEKIKDRICVE